MKRIVILALLLIAVPAYGQRKPDPEPVDTKAATRPDFKLFAEAYERADEPVILFIVGVADEVQPGGSREQTVSGTASGQRHVGAHLSLFDATGDSKFLQDAMEQLILEGHPDTEIVQIDALAEADRRTVEQMQDHDEMGAIREMSRALNADLVVLIRLLGGSEVARRGAMYRVSMEIIDPSRGRKIGGGLPFDWKNGAESESIKQYARALTKRLIEQFAAAHASGSMKYTVKLVGISDAAQLNSAAIAFGAIAGVEDVKKRSFNTSVSELTVKYEGSPLDLADALQAVATEATGVVMQATDAVSGSITLIAAKAPPPAPKLARWQIIMDETHPEHAGVIAQLKQEYTAEGRPKIGILITTDRDAKQFNDPGLRERDTQAEGSKEGGVQVNIGVAGRDVNQGDGEGTNATVGTRESRRGMLDSRRVENLMVQHINKHDLDVFDAHAQFTRIIEARPNRTSFIDDEIVTLLSDEAKLDITIIGEGKIDPSAVAQGESGVVYTFYSRRRNDNMILGTSEWAEASHREFLGKREVTEDMVARESAAKMLDLMLTKWEK